LWSSQGQNSAAKSENSVKEGKNLTSQRQNALERAKNEKKREAVLECFYSKQTHFLCQFLLRIVSQESNIQPASCWQTFIYFGA